MERLYQRAAEIAARRAAAACGGGRRRIRAAARRRAEPIAASTEAALRAALDEMNELYEHAPCAYHSLNADGVFVRINQTELDWLGHTREEIVGKIHLADLLTPESKQTFAVEFPRFLERGFVNDLALTFVRKDGSTLPVSASARAVKDAAGDYLHSVSTMIDVSERRAPRQRRRLWRPRSDGRRTGCLPSSPTSRTRSGSPTPKATSRWPTRRLCASSATTPPTTKLL